MGFNDFWINNNGKKEQLNNAKHGVRKEQVDKKFHNLFDAYDANGDGTLENEELGGIFKGLTKLAGADKTLDASENRHVASLFASQAGIQDADFMGFVRSVSTAIEDIVDSKTTPTPDGGREVTTTYKDGTVETISYYADGEYKFKKSDKKGEGASYYTVGNNIDKQFTQEEIDKQIKGRYNQYLKNFKPAENKKPLSYSEFEVKTKQEFNIKKINTDFEDHTLRLSDRAQEDIQVRDYILNHYIETHQAAKDALKTMGILDDIGAAINADAGEIWNSIKNNWNGTEEEYQNFYELLNKFEPSYNRSVREGGSLDMMRKHPEMYFRDFETDMINLKGTPYNYEQSVKFQQTTEQYQNAQILKQRIDILNKAMQEVRMYQSEQDALVHAPAQNEGLNPASHIVSANKLLLQYFNNDQDAVDIILNGAIGNSESTIKAIVGLKEETEIQMKKLLGNSTFEQIQDDYKEQYKALYGTDFVPDELTDKIMDAKATGSMARLALITIISTLITRSPIMTEILQASAGSVEATGAAANFVRGLVAKYGQTAVQQGIKFAMTSGTLATDVGLTLINQATSERGLNGEELLESTKGSAKYIFFGAYVGAPLAQAVSRSLGKIGATSRLFEGGVKTAENGIQTTSITGEKLVQNFMKGGNKVLTTGGALLTEIGAFAGLDVASGDMDIADALKEQGTFLPKLKLMNHVLEYMLGSRVHTAVSKANLESAIEKSGVKNWNIKEIKTPNKTQYVVDIDGLPVGRFEDANQLATAMLERVTANFSGTATSEVRTEAVEPRTENSITDTKIEAKNELDEYLKHYKDEDFNLYEINNEKISKQQTDFSQMLANEKNYVFNRDGDVIAVERFTQEQRKELELMHEKYPQIIEKLINQKTSYDMKDNGTILLPENDFEVIEHFYKSLTTQNESKNNRRAEIISNCLDEGLSVDDIRTILQASREDNQSFINYLIKAKQKDSKGYEYQKYNSGQIRDLAFVRNLTPEILQDIETKLPNAKLQDVITVAEALNDNSNLVNLMLGDNRFDVSDIKRYSELPADMTDFVTKIINEKITDANGKETPRYDSLDITIILKDLKPEDIDAFNYYSALKNPDGTFRFTPADCKKLAQTKEDLSNVMSLSIKDVNGENKYLLSAAGIFNAKKIPKIYEYLKDEKIAATLRQDVKANSISSVYQDNYLKDNYIIEAQDKQNRPINITFRISEDNNVEYISTETTIYRKGRNITVKHFADGSRIVEEAQDMQSDDAYYQKTWFDSNGNQVRSEVLQPSEIDGEYTINRYDRNLNGKYIKTELGTVRTSETEGTSTVEKHLTSPDGTKIYQLKNTTSNSSNNEIVITDKDGIELLRVKREFQKFDDSHWTSSVNGQKYDIRMEDDNIIASKLDDNGNITETVTIGKDQLPVNLKHLYRQLAGDYFFIIKETGVKISTDLNEYTRSKSGAAYDAESNTIVFNPKYQKTPFVFIHELGHTIDWKLLDKLHDNPDFVNSLEDNKINYNLASTSAESKSVNYFTRPEPNKPYQPYSEAIAETWAILSGENPFTVRSTVLQANMASNIAFAGRAMSDPAKYIEERRLTENYVKSIKTTLFDEPDKCNNLLSACMVNGRYDVSKLQNAVDMLNIKNIQDDNIVAYDGNIEGQRIRQELRDDIYSNTSLLDADLQLKKMDEVKSVNKGQLPEGNKYYDLGQPRLNSKTGQQVFIFENMREVDGFDGLRGKNPLGGRNIKGIQFKLKKLKDAGITTMIDFRAEGECNENALKAIEKLGMQYYNFHIDDGIWDVENVKRIPGFLDAMNKGQFFAGCANGQARTDLGMVINYILNPKAGKIPQLYYNQTSSGRLSVSKNIRQIKQILDQNPELIKEMGWNNIDEFNAQFVKKFEDIQAIFN